ncbi:MAG: hypothetical protein V4539_00125 [Bacteroidota bacterium]
MDYIDLLTKCLLIMHENGDKNIDTSTLRNKFGFSNNDEAIEVLEKFAKDGYVIKYGSSDRWQISIDGRLFVEYGGYRQHKADQDLNREYQLGENKRAFESNAYHTKQGDKLNRLTSWVAFGTTVAAVYYFLEVVKLFFPCLFPKT